VFIDYSFTLEHWCEMHVR